jgi:hypothetical protein
LAGSTLLRHGIGSMPPSKLRRRRTGEVFLVAGVALLAVVALSAGAVRAYSTATGLADHIVAVRQEA